MSSMGQRIKALRLSKHLTQTKLAERAGVKQNTISDLERGDTQEMMAETLQALCKELVTTPSYILHGVADGEAHEAQLREAELIALFKELPAQAQAALVNSARLLREAIPTNSPAQPIMRPKRGMKNAKPDCDDDCAEPRRVHDDGPDSDLADL